MILDTSTISPFADVSGPEGEIEQLVYSLYGLTREEIAIIEDSLQEKTVNGKVGDDAELDQEA